MERKEVERKNCEGGGFTWLTVYSYFKEINKEYTEKHKNI